MSNTFYLFLNVGNLNLTIPWKHLYTQPVVAVLEDIYLLIVPSSSKSNFKHSLTYFVDRKCLYFIIIFVQNTFGEFFEIFIFIFSIR